MSSWIKTDHDFGMPWIRLVVDVSSRAGRALLVDIQCCQENPQAMADVLANNIGGIRPDLRGCSVWSIRQERCPTGLTLEVSHPSLPRVRIGEVPPQQWLEPCPVCGKGINIDAGLRVNDWWRSADQQMQRVCSEACSKAEQHEGKDLPEMTDVQMHDAVCRNYTKVASAQVGLLQQQRDLEAAKRWSDQIEKDIMGYILCAKRYSATGALCERERGHPGMHLHTNGNDGMSWNDTASAEVNMLQQSQTIGTTATNELSLVQSGKMFRCAKCGKLRLRRDAAESGTCKLCVKKT